MNPDNPEMMRGTCSFCGETVTGQHAIIQYETASGEPGVWAECPSCGEIVDPINPQ
jgi:RNase P subunit RPR2